MGEMPPLLAALLDDHRRIEAAVARVTAHLPAALSGPHDPVMGGNALADVQGLQRLLENEVALHIAKEEEILFPAVRSAVEGIRPLPDDMVAEHDEVRARRELLGRTLGQIDDDHGSLLDAAARLGHAAGRHGDSPGGLESADLDQLGTAVRQLDWLLQGHFTGEEDGIFLPAEDLLPAEAFSELARRSEVLDAAWNAAPKDTVPGAAQRRASEYRASLPVFALPEGLAAVSDWRLKVEGLVHSPLVLDVNTLRSLPAVTLTADFLCEEGWAVAGLRWRGVPLQALLALAGVQAAARYVAIGSAEFIAVVPLASLRAGEPLLGYELGDTPLTREHGGPLRLVASDVACYQSVKWVDRLELTAEPPEETAKRIATERSTRR